MNQRAIGAIVRKDLTVALRSKFVVMPLIFVPLAIVVVLPLVIGLGMSFVDTLGGNPGNLSGDLQELLQMLPPEIRSQFADRSAAQAAVELFLRFTFAPLYLLLPMMTATVIAADSFAGEKERKTLEALIYTPTTDFELLLAKFLGGWIPGVAVAWGSFIVYCVVANLAAWPTLQRIFMPDTMWLILALWVAPASAALGLGVTVIASARVNTFQEAYQLGGLIVLPVMAILIAQVSGVLYLSPGLAVGLGVILWLIALLTLWIGTRVFRRVELLAKL